MLIEQLGLEGYGIFWVLVEILRDQPDYKYPLKLVPSLARKYNSTFAKMLSVIQEYDLFETTTDGKFFFSHSLVNRMEMREEVSEKQRANALKRWHSDDSDAMALPRESHCNARKGKEKKENKTKSKESIRELLAQFPTDFQEAFQNFSDMRKKIRKPMTDYAAKLILDKLKKLSPDIQTQTAILNQSTMNCWQGVFELHNDNQAKCFKKAGYINAGRLRAAAGR